MEKTLRAFQAKVSQVMANLQHKVQTTFGKPKPDNAPASSELQSGVSTLPPTLGEQVSSTENQLILPTAMSHTQHVSIRRTPLSPAEKKLRMMKLIRLMAIAGLVSIFMGILLFFGLFAWFSRDLPKPGQVVRRDGFSTQIYDRNGNLLYDLFDEERRNPIKIEQVPEYMKQATIAIEDKDFYRHSGFDWLTPFRIVYNMIFRQRVVGGSTLTQQVVKNVLLDSDRSFIGGPIRKFKEFVLALQIERTFTKDQILEMYLNEVPYGGTAWGAGTAAEIYFNKPISELTLAQSALLAGLPQRPSAYSPYNGKNDTDGTPLWRVRARGVLRRMKEDGYITDLAYEEANSQLETMTFERAAVEIKAPHFVFYVRDKLIEMYGEQMAEQGGLKVTTTLDLDFHNMAQTIVKEEIEKVKDFNITNGAAIVQNPQTGEILSMVGSKDYFDKEIDGQFNVAVDALRQPGSSIKPLTYLNLIMQGYTPAMMFMDVETTFAPNDKAETYKPKNYDGKFRGPVTMRTSLGSSLNIPAVKALAVGGLENFLQLAYDMGFATFEPTPQNLRRYGLALTLGGGEVHMIDTSTAYSAFANGGHKIEPVAILKVEDKDGHQLYQYRPTEGKRVIPEDAAFLINHMLSDNNARVPAFGANSLLNTGKPIAVKTGTTNEQKDNWAVGWAQDFIVTVWVGNNNNTSMTRVASGVTGASPIWRRIVDELIKRGFKTPDWSRPDTVEEVQVDTISGYPVHDEFPARTEYVIKGTLPSLPDPIHTKLKLCKGENKLATDAKIASADYEEKEFYVLRENDPVSQDGKNRWQEAIDAWVNGQTDGKYKPPTEYCGEQSDVSVRVAKPDDQSNHSGEDIEIHVDADSGDGIEKIEIWVDGGLRETVNSRSYRGTLKITAGRHEIYAKAKSRNGKEAESNHVKIGTGGQDWKPPETPAPTPTPNPSDVTVNASSDGTAIVGVPENVTGSINPSAGVTSIWTGATGPGGVTFGNVNDLNTTATFSAPGAYEIRLIARREGFPDKYAAVNVIVTPAGP